MQKTLLQSALSSPVTKFLGLTLAWLAVWQVGRLVEYTDHASVWFPVAGLTFACLLVWGWRAFPSIMLGAIIITIWSGNHYQLPLSLSELIWAGFLFGLAHTIPYWLGGLVLRNIAAQSNQNAPKLIVTFLVLAGVTALATTALVIGSLVITNQLPLADVSKTLLPFWIGDLAGVVVLAPLFSGLLIGLSKQSHIDLSQFLQQSHGPWSRLGIKTALNITLIVMTMLLAYLSEAPESSFAIFFLAITHMWIACTESPVFNVVSLAVSSFLIALLVHLFGLMDHVMVYQFAINVIAANALFGIAVPQLQAHNQELTQMVFTDPLTKASSRHFLEHRAQEQIDQSHAKRLPLSLAVFDLDDFKSINDRHGHSVGDVALAQISEQAQLVLRKGDVIARFGGDEFVVLLPETDLESAQKIVDRIKVAINELSIEEQRLSASFGIAGLSHSESFKELFHRADQALYASKELGGNQITHANEPAPS